MENNDKKVLQLTNEIVLYRIAINTICSQVNIKNDKLNFKKHHLMSLIKKIENESDIAKIKKITEKIINFIEKNINIKEFERIDKNLVIKALSSSAQLNKLDYNEKQSTIDNVSKNITISAIISLKNCLNKYYEVMNERELLIRKKAQDSINKEDNKKVNSSSTKEFSVIKSNETITLNDIVKMAKNIKEATINYLLSIQNDSKLSDYEDEKGFEKYDNARRDFIKQFKKLGLDEQRYLNEHFVRNYQSYVREFSLGNVTSVEQIATTTHIKHAINKSIAQKIESMPITKDSYVLLSKATRHMDYKEITNIYNSLKGKMLYDDNDNAKFLQNVFSQLVANKFGNDESSQEILYNIQLLMFEIKNMQHLGLESISNTHLKLCKYKDFLSSNQISIEPETCQSLIEDINVALYSINRFLNQPNPCSDEEKCAKRI